MLAAVEVVPFPTDNPLGQKVPNHSVCYNLLLLIALSIHEIVHEIVSASTCCLQVKAVTDGVHFVMCSGTPLHEPVVQHGPFVMNTAEQIQQAREDYANGTLC